MTAAQLAARVGAKRVGREYVVRCPAHDDTDPSLNFSNGQDGRIVFICRSHGCDWRDILAAWGLSPADVVPERSSRDPEATYDYVDERGTVLCQKVRSPGRRFWWRRPDGAGGWIHKRGDTRRVVYRLHELQGRPFAFVVEGEKDADRLVSVGLVATTNPDGASEHTANTKWREDYTQQLVAAGVQSIVVLPDCDGPGTAHADSVARSCHTAGLRVKVLPLPGLTAKQDVSDWFDRGGTKDALLALAKAAPVYAPSDPAVDDNAPVDDDRIHRPDDDTSPAEYYLDPEALHDAVAVAAEGQQIAQDGIRYLLHGVIPNYGTLGMLVAYAKTGKTTFAQQLGAAVAMGRPFLDQPTTAVRVLVIAAEDPPEYVAWLARHLDVDPERMTFYRASLRFDPLGLAQIAGTVQRDGYGLVLVSSWQAVIRGLVRDENDNSGMVTVTEAVKAVTRQTKTPWLVDAHSGKGEDQSDEADPSRALRGASSAAGAADYALWLRYADGAFGCQRRLSGKGRFVDLAPLTLTYDVSTGGYERVSSTKTAVAESTWRLIDESQALTQAPQTAGAIARSIGLLTRTGARQVAAALYQREGVGKRQENQHGKNLTLYYAIHEDSHG